MQAVGETLDQLLYRRGGDGILELSVSRSEPGWLTLVGLVVWVEDQTLAPLEAVFRLDASGFVKRFTVRAGDARLPRRDVQALPLGSWRARLRLIEARPTEDEDWEHVLDYAPSGR